MAVRLTLGMEVLQVHTLMAGSGGRGPPSMHHHARANKQIHTIESIKLQ
jgi:hypothetical protein